MRHRINLGAFAIIILALAAASAHGQLAQKYRADIPFDFSVGNSDLKSGSYAIGMFNDSSSTPVLGLLNRDNGRSMAIKPVIRSGFDYRDRAVLKFIRTGDHYDLAEIKGGDFDTKLRRTWSNVRQVTRGVAGAEPETVNIYLN